MLLAGVMALAGSSCTNDFDYQSAPKASSQIYFSNTQEKQISIDKNAGSFDIILHRANKEGAVTVPLTFTPGEGNIFTVPAEVSFMDGSDITNIHITYDPAKAEYGVYTGGVITISDPNVDSNYGLTSLTFTAGPTEWVDITANNSIGKMRDDCITTIFQFNGGAPTWNVKIQQSVVTQGMYRIVNPYEEWYSEEAKAATPSFSYDDTTDHGWVINATDPDYVYLEDCQTGMSYTAEAGYGQLSLMGTAYLIYQNSLPQNPNVTMDMVKQQFPQYFGTLKDGVITFPTPQSMCIALEGLKDGAWLDADKDGLFAVALPGHIIADYSIDAAYNGRFTDTSDNDFARFNITLGSDVASAKYALASSTEQVAKVAAGITDGSIESQEISESGSVDVAYTETGSYNLVIVGYNANGEASVTKSLSVKLQSSKDAQETFEDIAAGIYTIGRENVSDKFWNNPWSDKLPFGDNAKQEAVLSQSSTDPTHFRITPYLTEESYLDFYVDENNNITLEPQGTGISTRVEEGADPVEIYVADLYTQFTKEDPNFASQLDQYGWHSTYIPDQNGYVFILNFSVTLSDGTTGFLGLTQVDQFVVEDEAQAAINRARAKAKGFAKSKSYIMRADAKHKSLGTQMRKPATRQLNKKAQVAKF